MELPFPESIDKSKPLADRMRARNLDEFIGQEKIVGQGSLLRRSLEQGRLRQSLILWGPPGCGKTTLARIIAHHVQSRFMPFSAVTSGIAEVKRVIADARKMRSSDGRALLVFVDEIHRFNKAQQDAFLPHVEDGTIVLVGATTENPSFEVIGPLLSRARVLVLEPLGQSQVVSLLRDAVEDVERGLGDDGIDADDDVLSYIADLAQGDARVALNALDYTASVLRESEAPRIVTRDLAEEALQRRTLSTDKAGESHYNLVSALIKSLRGSDVDAALYWLARLVEAGEDPMFVARRLVILASEDIGNADPHALPLAIAAKEAVSFIGYPECRLALSQAVTYLALAPKSNASYTAYSEAARIVKNSPPHPVPLHLRNAPTAMMKDLGYGKNYKYSHDMPDEHQAFLPEALSVVEFYKPKDVGFEAELRERLARWRKQHRNDGTEST